MRPLTKSLLLYLLVIGLLSGNLYLVSDFPLSTYIMYILIFAVVFYSSDNIFWGKKSYPGLLSGTVLIGAVFSLEILAGLVKVEGFDFNFSLLVSFFIFQLLVAAGEEISFRGYILKNLKDEIGIKNAISLSSFMFATIHIPSFIYYRLDISRIMLAFMVIGLLGAVVSIIYLNYGLISAIAFHFAWNFLQYNIFNLSETQPGIMEISYMESNLLTGGNYGPEAGILGFIVVLFALIILVKKSAKNLS